jgi:hypothetical protein
MLVMSVIMFRIIDQDYCDYVEEVTVGDTWGLLAGASRLESV